MLKLSNIEKIVEDARNGKLFVLVDDENRENEGDLIFPAQLITPDIINLRNLVAPSPSSIIFFASFLETFMIKCLRM